MRIPLGALVLGAIALISSVAAQGDPAAKGKLAVIDFQEEPPSVVYAGGSRPLRLVREPGAKGPGVLWGAAHQTSGGWNDRPFMRFSWWDWDVSRVGHQAEQAGWTGSGAWFRPPDGWLPFGPYFLRFRIRITAPILPHTPTRECDGDTQMKFFIWNAFTGSGLDRVIMMLHAGSEGGRSDQNDTTLDLRAGVSGSHARATFRNHEWVHVQLGWRWGPEKDAYQRIWIDNNAQDKPTAQNRRFGDLNASTWGGVDGASGLDQQFFIGDIANTGSCVREDAEIDLMDVELATEFDPTWFPAR